MLNDGGKKRNAEKKTSYPVSNLKLSELNKNMKFKKVRKRVFENKFWKLTPQNEVICANASVKTF